MSVTLKSIWNVYVNKAEKSISTVANILNQQ